MPVELQTFFMAMLPVIELRGAIPFAIIVGELSPTYAYVLAVMGNIIPIFLIFALLESVSLFLSRKFYFIKIFFDFLFQRTRRDYDGRIKKYGYFALLIFTAIPLPITGAWTASLAAFLFNLSRVKSIIAIIGGVMISGGVVLFITGAGIELESSYGPQFLAGVICLILLIYAMYYINKTNKKTKSNNKIISKQ